MERLLRCFLTLLLLLPQMGWAQQARLYLPTDTLSIGGRYSLHASVRHAPAWRLLVPEDSTFGDMERLELRTHRTFRTREFTVDSLVWEVTTFALDSAAVGPVRFQLVSGEDTLEVVAPAFFRPVRSVVPPDARDIQDIAPPFPFPLPTWVYVLTGGLLALLLFLGAAYFRRRKTPTPAPPPPEPVPDVPPYTRAMEALEYLAQHLPQDAEAVKPFYVHLSLILRTYLAETCHIPARELSSSELLSSLKSSLSPVLFDRLAALLDVMDRVKFARYRPAPDLHPLFLRETRALIEALETHHADVS